TTHTTEIYTLSLHDALPISTFDLKSSKASIIMEDLKSEDSVVYKSALGALGYYRFDKDELPLIYAALDRKYQDDTLEAGARTLLDRKSTRLNSSHVKISYAV